ncbi:MAG: hypothetical protein MJA82_06865 [Clostridia bacterium]|nr:hypothetical protein [Clostridia bacterium]
MQPAQYLVDSEGSDIQPMSPCVGCVGCAGCNSDANAAYQVELASAVNFIGFTMG